MIGDFLDDIARRFSKNDSHFVEQVFQNLLLPIPQQKSAFFIASEGFLVPMNTYGCLIRIERPIPKDFRRVRTSRLHNPCIIEPIHIWEGEKANVELCPGLAVKDVHQKDVRLLDELLAQCHLCLADDQMAQVGYLPAKTDFFPRGVPCIIDPLSVEEMVGNKVSSDPKLLRILSELGEVQASLYGGLRQALAQAWSSPHQPSDKTKIKSFWNLCKKASQTHYNGFPSLLNPGWKDCINEGRTKASEVARCAAIYERQLTTV